MPVMDGEAMAKDYRDKFASLRGDIEKCLSPVKASRGERSVFPKHIGEAHGRIEARRKRHTVGKCYWHSSRLPTTLTS